MLRQLIGLLAGMAVLEMLLPRGGMNRVCRLALGMALIAGAVALLSDWSLPSTAGETVSIWRSGSAYQEATYAEEVLRAWEAMEENGNEP